MLQFTQTQTTSFRARAALYPEVIRKLKQSVAEVQGHFLIPPNKAATWAGFYACPKHSVKLEFDIASPTKHRCPVDGEWITGAVYDGAWWRLVNEANYHSCYHAALLSLVGGGDEYLGLAKKYLVEYAKVYPSYEIHGGIPYNNPGKANAQTLCDAAWVKGLLLAYDIIGEHLTGAERDLIETQLFRCCADFLMEYRSGQVHNHEAVVDAAIAMIGLVLDEKRYLDFGLNEEYGLKDQLKRGTLADGLWFEGTPGYHFYALEQYLLFETLACRTGHSFFHDPRFGEILKFPLRVLQPGHTLPPLNDVGFGYSGLAGAENLYELAYRETSDPGFLQLLRLVYQGKARDNLWSFFYGVETLPATGTGLPRLMPYHGGKPGESGLTTMFGTEGRFLLVKHSPFGGEHDHYDRLGIHFTGFGQGIIPDIGTCPYGAPMHYAYYKNTLSHNTVCLNGENQPPTDCTVYAYERDGTRTVLDVGCGWDGHYVPMDTFVIKQWSEEAYAGASFRRYIAWYDGFFVDIFKVTCPEEREIDYVLHVRGERIPAADRESGRGTWAEQGPGRYLHHVTERKPDDGRVVTKWRLDEGQCLEITSFMETGSRCYHMSGPDNPAVRDLSYMIQRAHAKECVFVNVISWHRHGLEAHSPVEMVFKHGSRNIIYGNPGHGITVPCPY